MVDQSRFWIKVNKTDGCWNWIAGTNKRPVPYGLFRVDGKQIGAHRVSWYLAHGRWPGDLQVLHSCDNSLCVNPDHLFLGTQLDNVRDAMSKKRHPKGETNGRSKLTEQDVREIRKLISLGETNYSAIGRKFGVTITIITKIRDHELWSHVE